MIDAGFLELARLGELSATDPDILASLPVVDATIRSDTDSGPGWHRYNGDGYGDDSSDGSPWAPSGVGTGHVWPALSAERGEQMLQTGDSSGAASLLDGMDEFAGGVGLIPEQDWESANLAASPFGTAPETASIGFVDGEPAGSASPLSWSAASFVRLFADIGAGRLVDRPQSTYRRYVAHTQGTTPLTVTSPADQSAVSASPVTVAGTTAPGNKVYVSATNTDANSATTSVTTTADGAGAFSVAVPVTGGTTVLNVVAVSASGGTAHVQRSVVFDFVPGTLLLDVPDPSNDDNGPGNYAYPTSDNFKPGAFDIQDFQVFDDGSDIIFRLRTRDLTPTFGSPLGAQLVDVYVHVPGAADDLDRRRQCDAQLPDRAAPYAWSRLIQVQGFGQRYVDASGATLGTVAISANQISRFITFSVTKAIARLTGPGLGLHRRSHRPGRLQRATRREASSRRRRTSSSASARRRAPTRTARSTRALVPKAVDVITPTGVLQSDELDYTLHSPVVITGVSIP